MREIIMTILLVGSPGEPTIEIKGIYQDMTKCQQMVNYAHTNLSKLGDVYGFCMFKEPQTQK